MAVSTRRDFLWKASALSAAAASHSRAVGVSVKSKYRAAVIGHTGRGNYGHGLDKVWNDVPGVQVVAVADAHPEGLKQTVQALHDVKGYADYHEMLEMEKPDLVTVGPRWLDQHRDMVVAAADQHVKGIYLEKPMCRDLQEADEMVAACEKSGTKLGIATQTRYSPQMSIIRDMLKNDQLGRLVEVRARGKEDRRGGGEDLWVLGTHVLDLMRHFGGDAQQCYGEVLQEGRPVTRADVKPGPEGIGPLAGDEVHAMFRLASGATGYWDSVRNARGEPTRFGIRFYGTKGVIELFDTGSLPFTRFLPASAWSTARSGKQWVPITSNGIGQPETRQKGSLHEGNVVACRDLIAAIEENRQPVTNIYEARKTVEMIAAIFESHRVRGPVSLPLKTRQNPLTLLK